MRSYEGKILVLGAGKYNTGVIRELIRHSFHVIAVDRNADAPGKDIAHEFYPIDVIDQTSLRTLASRLDVDGIMNINEHGSRSACLVSHQLGLVGHAPNIIEQVNNKLLMRTRWLEHSVKSPSFALAREAGDVREFARRFGFPVVLKPTDSGGSGRGVSVIRDELDVLWSYNFAMKHAKNGELIVEQYIEGIELTVETFSINGDIFILASSDKVKPDLRTRVALSLNYPAAVAADALCAIEIEVKKAITALGILDGCCHTEVILTDAGIPYLVETGARGGGGHIFHTIIERVSGLSAPLLQAKWLTKKSIHIDQIKRNGCCYRFFNPPAGRLVRVDNLEAARAIPGVIDLGIDKKPGDLVGNLENSLERAGFVVTIGATRDEAVSVADRVERTVAFVIGES